jgi:hypothetical protein
MNKRNVEEDKSIMLTESQNLDRIIENTSVGRHLVIKSLWS